MAREIAKYEFATVEEQRLFDVNAKMEMARNIIVRICLAKRYNSTENNSLIVKEGSKYFPIKILNQLVENAYSLHIKSTTKTFDSWIKHSMSKRDLYLVENNAIDKISRDIIVEHYVRQKTLLSKDVFIHKINNIAYQRALDVDLYLKTRGYKSKRLPHSTESIIIEDPELRFARMLYLQSIKQSRKAGANIVYIDTKIANSSGLFLEKIKLSTDTKKVLTIFQRAVSPVLGMLSKKIRETPIILNFDTYDDPHCFQMKWIIETVAPQISTPSVFVLEDNIFYGQTYHGNAPTMYSSKVEMLNWLEANDIPHSSNMHSAELLELIKKSKRNLFKKYILDETLKSYGHKVLRRPQGTNYLDYFDTLWEKVMYKPLSEKLYLFNQTSCSNWQSLDKALSEIEEKVLQEDIAVNNTIEKLLTYSKNERKPYYDATQLLYRANHIDEFKMEDIVKIL